MRSTILIAAVAALGAFAATAQTEWRDPSPHLPRFVTVAPDVRLEVLDWGGTEEGVPGARVVRLVRAHHYVFLSNEADVLRELHAFVAGLRFDAVARP